MRGEWEGSYTVEAAFIMAVALWTSVALIRASYGIHDETVGAFALHEAVVQLAHRDSMTGEQASGEAKRRAGHPFSFEGFQFRIKKEEGLLSGGRIYADGRGGKWRLEMEQKIFEPENFLRMLTLTGQKE